MNKIVFIVGIILFIGGLAFSFLPHDSHNILLGYVLHQHSHTEHHGLEEEHGSHGVHQKIGYVAVAAGLGLAVFAYFRREHA